MIMQTNVPVTTRRFRIIRNILLKKMNLWALLIMFLVGSNGVNAQRIININNEIAIQRASQQITPEQVKDDYYGVSEQIREFDFNPQLLSLTKENEGDVLLLDFFEGKRFNGKIINVTCYPNGVTCITAKIDDASINFCHIAVSKAGISIIADILEKNESYIVAKKGNTTYLCRYKTSTLREKELPGAKTPDVEAILNSQPVAIPVSTQGAVQQSAMLTPPVTLRVDKGQETLPAALDKCGLAELNSSVQIDVLAVYTPNAKQWAQNSSSVTDIDHVIVLAMANANMAMFNSNTNITFNMVYSHETNYTETTNQYVSPEPQRDIDDALSALRATTDGKMDEVHALRKQYHADLVMLFGQVEGAGGVGYLLNRELGSYDLAFAVSRVQQAWTGYTTIHEIGHNMGCTHHKLQNDGEGLYSYSYGWRGVNSSGNYSTIMTYENFDETYYPRIGFFSDPDITHQGVVIGDVDEGNNALTLRRTKRLISLYSDVINTSLTDMTISAGTLSPAFDTDITDYVVEVANGVSAITITGIPNYDCATVTGEATDSTLAIGANIFTLTVRSHDNRVSKSYKVTVLRNPPACYSYESRPVFPDDITAPAGDAQLNLFMNPAVPITDHSNNVLTLEMPAAFSPIYIRENSNLNASCHYLGNTNNFVVYLGNERFKVTEDGSYRFTLAQSAILSLFDTETPSCGGFMTSNFYWSGNGNSYSNQNNYIDVTLEANKMYYLRATQNRQQEVTTPTDPLNITITGPGFYYTESVIPYGMDYTYIAFNQSDSLAMVQSSTGDFMALPTGVYTVYGVPYSTIGTADPSYFAGKTKSELQLTGCFTLSETAVQLTVTNNNATYGISISSSAGGSVSVSSPSSSDGSSVPVGETVTLAITCDPGYELKAIDVYKTSEPATKVIPVKTGDIQSFTMPDFGVTITATFDYTDNQQTVFDARDAINAATTFTFAQADVYDATTLKAALIAAINALLAGEGINYMVNTDTITLVSTNFAIAGTAGNTAGTDGDFSFTVKLKMGIETTEETTNVKNGVITATPYDSTQDNTDIAAAKLAIEGASFTDTQVNIPTVVEAKAKATAVINSLNLNGVAITITNETFTAAIAGTALNKNGTDGSYTFKVELTKGAGIQQTTNELTLTITATVYDSSQDDADIAAAKVIIDSAAYTTTQTDVFTQSQAIIKVESIIAGLSLNGVTTEVVEGLFTAAIAGTASSLNGTDGSFTFTVKLNKGGGTEVITGELTLTITATPYDATQDNADITTAKATLEGETYMTTQALAPDVASAKTEVEAMITSLSLNGVTTDVTGGAFVSAITGTAGTPGGTNGSYAFTVELSKGGGTPQVTGPLSLTITATPYTPPATYLVTIASTTYGTITALPANPVEETETVTLTITPTEGYELDMIDVHRSNDVNVTVTLIGTGTACTFTMPAFDVTVEASFKKTTDQTNVEAAIQLINSMSNASILQATANTVPEVTDELVQMINGLPGMGATGISVVAADITFSGFTAATAGTATSLSGTNGSFAFTVTLKKTNSASMTSSSKSGVITATAYDTTQGNADIAATKSVIENATFTTTQTDANTQSQAKAKVEAIITGLTLNGVTTEMVENQFTPAVEGAVGTPNGTNGSYTFTVKLNKGGGMESITVPLTLTITATAYNPAQDNADITAAKAAIEGTAYLTTQLNAPDATKAKEAVEAIISALSLNGVTTNVVGGTFTAATAGTSGTPNGTNGYYTFTVELDKGEGAQQTTSPLTLTITATPFTPPDTYLITIASIVNGTVTALPVNPVEETETVVLTITPAEGYELDMIDVYRSSDVNVTVTLSGTGAARTFTMPSFDVTIEASFKKTTDQTNVEAAIQLINSMSSVSILQATANTVPEVTDELVQMINGLAGMGATGINVVAADITISGFTAATAGTATSLAGTNGSFTFTVTLKKTNSASMTSSSKSGVITATPYDTTQDNVDIAAAKTVIEGATYVDLQVNIQTLADAKVKVEAIIAGLSLNGVSAVVVEGMFTAASEGTTATPGGSNGSFKFTVKLNKGGGTEVITNELTLTITATPYNATQDNDDITAIKAIVEGMTYVTTQINAPDMASAKAAVEAILSQLPLNGVTTNVVNDLFTAATAGTAGTPNGIDGSYTFTVKLNKGGGTEQTTITLTLDITATPYSPVGSYLLNIGLTTNGAVTASPSNPVTANTNVTLTITPTAGYELNSIDVYNTIDANQTVTLSGTGNTRTFTMPSFDVTVDVTFTKTTDQLAVETAIGLIDGLSNTTVLQETANTEAAVKTWLANQINALPGMSVTGITVNANDITISGFSAATAGIASNPSGTNGSFTFFVTLTKIGSATEQSTVKSGVIIATNYTAINYVVTIDPTVNGTVTPSQTNATAGTTILLSITPAQGYELDVLSAFKTGDTGTSVVLTAIGASYQFVMPVYDVTVQASFRGDADQLAIAAAKTAIENMSNTTVSQSTANTEATVKGWLVQQINALQGVSANGIIVTAANISFSSFTEAVEGTANNTSGTNGSFTFTVSLQKGSSITVTTAGKNGVITATGFVAPSYTIYFNAIYNGVVTADRTRAAAGETVTLTIIPSQGYELESLSAGLSVTITGTGNTRTFIMPSHFVTINATFKKTQEQLEKEELEAVKFAIEGGTYRIAQATGNTSASVRTWLVNTLRVMFGNNYNIQLRSSGDPVIGDVTVTALTPAVTGTATNPAGTNGSFTFTVSLKLGATTLVSPATKGTIVAMPYASTPLKQIELLQLNNLTVRISNTGNIETGALTLELTGTNADAFTLPASTTNSLSVGDETELVLSLRKGLNTGVYKATLIVSGENLPAASLEITYTVTITGNEALQTKTLKAWAQNDMLHVSGLTVGQAWSVYSISGVLLHRNIAGAEEAKIGLPNRGVYIIISGTNTVKVTF